MRETRQYDEPPQESDDLDVRSLVWPVLPTQWPVPVVLAGVQGAAKAVRCRDCGGAQWVDGVRLACRVCGTVGYLTEPALSPRERHAARRRLDELGDPPTAV